MTFPVVVFPTAVYTNAVHTSLYYAQSEHKHVLANISRLRYNTPAVWTKWNGLVADNIVHAAGASILSLAKGVFAGMRSGEVGLADYRGALPCISSVAITTQPVHQLQIRPIVHN